MGVGGGSAFVAAAVPGCASAQSEPYSASSCLSLAKAEPRTSPIVKPFGLGRIVAFAKGVVFRVSPGQNRRRPGRGCTLVSGPLPGLRPLPNP